MSRVGQGTHARGAVAAVLAATLLGAASLAVALQQPSAEGAAGGPKVIASDSGVAANPVPFWGAIECERESRHAVMPSGGDSHPTATGAPQGNSSYRSLTVIDGDDFYGERCELGLNNRGGPTAFYREGKRRITAISLRLPSDFPVDRSQWRVVTQMKQANPAANTAGSPMLELQVFNGRWRLIRSRHRGLTGDSKQLWSAPAQTGVWTRFSFDIRYSRKPKKGRVRVIADLNGDGDYLDPGERSRKIRTFTLKTEISGGAPDGIRPGASIPSHLRTGLYQEPSVSCPPPGGCHLDVDNIQILAP